MISQPTILQVSKYYPPAVGGIEQVVQTLAEGLPSDVRVLAAADRGIGHREYVNDVQVTRAGRLSVVKSVPIAPTFPIRLATMSRDTDLVHYHLPNPLAVVSHFLTGSDTAPLVATYHSDVVRQRTALQAYRPLLNRFLERLDAIIVTSPAMLEHSDCLQEHADKCTVIPLSVDLETFGGNTPSVDLPIDERPTLLFVGRLTYYKGVDRLIDAVVDIDANVLLVGDGNQRESLERRVRDLGISDRVQFLGRVDDRTLHACYDAADVFVLPSVAESEAFGIVQLEAMAYGTPVINTDLPTGVPWVSRDGKTGVTVPPDDSEALADAIAVLLDDPKRRATYGEAARRRVEAEFSRERMLERTEELYDRLLNKGEWL